MQLLRSQCIVQAPLFLTLLMYALRGKFCTHIHIHANLFLVIDIDKKVLEPAIAHIVIQNIYL